MNDPRCSLQFLQSCSLGALKMMFSCKAARTADCKWRFALQKLYRRRYE